MLGPYEVHLVGTPSDRWIIVTDPNDGSKHYGHEHTGHGLIKDVGIDNGSPATLIYTDGMGLTDPIAPGSTRLGPHVSGSNLHIDLSEIGAIDAGVNKDILIDLVFDNANPADPAFEWQLRLEFGGHGVGGPAGARLYALELDSSGTVLENVFGARFGFDSIPIDMNSGAIDLMFVPPMMIPEPAAFSSCLLGLGLVSGLVRRRRR
ncbi:MAG: hypothetical protein KDA37_05755 [Planctomycetales bacterium]|nr:hypothetical protein [Planctomycetales bacterium]